MASVRLPGAYKTRKIHSMNTRKQRILQAVVNDYVMTTKPVGSERLIEFYNLGCKSATVRNEMAEMVEKGYLVQPHTSAGRIPTDQGYRYYVDEVMNAPAALTSDEVKKMHDQQKKVQTEIEDLILQTCRILSGITLYPSLATDPSTDSSSLRSVIISGASQRHILLVVLLSTGHVEHRLIELGAVPANSELTRINYYVNSVVSSQELEDVGRMNQPAEYPAEISIHAGTMNKIFNSIFKMAQTLSEKRVFLEGASQFLRQPEFQDVQRLDSLLAALEQRRELYKMLTRALSGCSITIIIGSENEFAPMQDCSIISTSYRIGSRAAGCIGVVGPTRMNYDRASAAVALMAQNLSSMLTSMYIS